MSLSGKTEAGAARGKPVKKPKRRTQAERSETTRAQLLEAAAHCLSEMGYVQATIAVVAAKAGVSRGAVQHQFGSRKDLLVAVVDDLGLALAAAEPIPANLSVAKRVSKSVDQTWTLLRSKRFRAVAQIWLSMQADGEMFTEIRAKVLDIERKLDKAWVQLFSDVSLPVSKIMLTRHVVLATLRGLSLRSTYRPELSASSDEIDMLKTMVARMLNSKHR